MLHYSKTECTWLGYVVSVVLYISRETEMNQGWQANEMPINTAMKRTHSLDTYTSLTSALTCCALGVFASDGNCPLSDRPLWLLKWNIDSDWLFLVQKSLPVFNTCTFCRLKTYSFSEYLFTAHYAKHFKCNFPLKTTRKGFWKLFCLFLVILDR